MKESGPLQLRTTDTRALSIESHGESESESDSAWAQGNCLLRRYAPFLTAMIALWCAAPHVGAQGVASQQDSAPTPQQVQPPASLGSNYEGKVVKLIELPGVSARDLDHLLQLVEQKTGEPLERAHVRESIRTLYATGRFADIQAEVTPSGEGVILTFTTSANFFVGGVEVEGAPTRPNQNQIINASKLQLGELYNRDKLDRALENVRQLMQEGGYYRARVTAESTSHADTQQVDILFHVTAGSPAHVGVLKVTGTSSLSPMEVQHIAHMDRGGRISAARVSDSLQHLRKRFQKQSRALAQVSIAEQTYHPETNAVDFTYQIDPGPVVVIYAPWISHWQGRVEEGNSSLRRECGRR